MKKNSQVTSAIRYIRKKGFNFIKIEFEALVEPIGGGYYEGESCDEKLCDDGLKPLLCRKCNATGEIEKICSYCDNGETKLKCSMCDGAGLVDDKVCTLCGGSGKIDEYEECGRCFGTGYEEEPEECDECLGSGFSDDYDFCDKCEGYGRTLERAGEEILYKFDFKKTFRKICREELNKINEDIGDIVKYMDVYLDVSAGTELTVTIPIEKADIIDLLVRVFNKTCASFGNDPATVERSITRAGMHMCLMKYEIYRSKRKLPSKALDNFKKNFQKFQLALIYLGSVDGKTRSLHYRGLFGPEVKIHEKTIDFHGDTCIEIRSFDPCYSHPEKALDNLLVIARLLNFYDESFKEKISLDSDYSLYFNFSNLKDYWGWKPLAGC